MIDFVDEHPVAAFSIFSGVIVLLCLTSIYLGLKIGIEESIKALDDINVTIIKECEDE